MGPSSGLRWQQGLKAGFARMHAKQRDQYSWVAKTDSGYVFTVEIDHVDKEHNRYDHSDGVFEKEVGPHTKEKGLSAASVSHAQEFYDAALDAHSNDLVCGMLLTKGTKSGKSAGPVKTAADADGWKVTELNGSVADGFSLRIERSSSG